MTERLIELARRIQARPWNRPGTDKTWVLHAMWEQQAFRREIRDARRGGSR
jgi:hypothetical protein